MLQRMQKKVSGSDRRLKFCLFSKFNKSRETQCGETIQHESPLRASPSEWKDDVVMVARPPPDVRLLLFHEPGDTGDRQIIFDSKRVRKAKSPACRSNRSYSSPDQSYAGCDEEIKSQYEYNHKRSPSDETDLLSEMLFGSVGTAQKVASLKIHYIKSPPGIMLSRVFCITPKEHATASLERRMESHFEALRSNCLSSRRKAQTMPGPFSLPTPSSISSSYSNNGGKVFHRSDSGVSLSSVTSLISNSARSVSGSLGTAAMRIPSSSPGKTQALTKHQRDSFSLIDEDGSGDSYRFCKPRTFHAFASPSEQLPSSIRRARLKIGFAVICEPEPSNQTAFQQFFFEHFPIIESHMTSLKENIEKALQTRPKCIFIELMMKAINVFKAKLHFMYSSQRLPEPVWASLSSPSLGHDHRKIVIASFIGDLTRLATEYNTKQRNHFFSGLLTAVLTYHLGWVSSAMPNQRCKTDDREKKSYNALWAQLGDLYGAVGAPTKVCRTVVTGNGHELISTILSVLSYFIRSARIKDVIPVPKKISPSTLSVEKLPKMQPVKVSYVPSEIEQSDYVLISVSNETSIVQPPTSTKPILGIDPPTKNQVLRSKSSPQSPKRDYNTVNLSRSNSGPMVRSFGRSRSNAILNSKFPNSSYRARTFSNNVISKPKGVQSRRNSRDPEVVVIPSMAGNNYEVLSSQSEISMNQNSTRFSTPNPSGTKQSSGLQQPGEKVDDYRDDSSFTNEAAGERETICRVLPSFAEFLPQVERSVNVQRSCPLNDVEDRTLPGLNPLLHVQAKKSAVFDQPITSLRKSSDFSELKSDEKQQQKSPSRSVSNPSFCARDNSAKQHKRCSSNTSARTLLGSDLVTSGTVGSSDDVLNSREESNDLKSNSISCERLQLLRIPSVEINHTAFDEYFSGSSNDTNTPSEKNVSFSDSTTTLTDIEERNEAICADTSDDATSFPTPSTSLNLTNISSIPPIQSSNLPKPADSYQAIPSLYPDLSTATPSANPIASSALPPALSNSSPVSPPRVPPRRQRNVGLNARTPYPPLPPTSPVVSFNVGDERVSFHDAKPVRPLNAERVFIPSTPLPPIPSHYLSPKLSPSRQWSCLSSTTLKPEDEDPFENLKELPLPSIIFSNSRDSVNEKEANSNSVNGFGSLMADYNQDYLNDFVLHGAPNHPEMHREILTDLGHAIRKPTLDEPIAEAICVVADTDSWSVKVYSSQRLHSERPCLPALTSKLVSCILNSVASMAKMKMDPEFCMNHLESELRQLVLKSRMLAEYARGQRRVTMGELSAALSIESQDLPLLMAIASCHSPHVAPILF